MKLFQVNSDSPFKQFSFVIVDSTTNNNTEMTFAKCGNDIDIFETKHLIEIIDLEE